MGRAVPRFAPVPRLKRRSARAAATAVALVAAAVGTGWLLRFEVATRLVDRKLAAADVPASYRITRIGPFLQRLEQVQLGDPARPDLIARRIDVLLGYGLGGPYVRAIRVDGVRLRARIDANGLSLGSIDRLLPQARGGQTLLPDLAVTIRDTRLFLATPNGAIAAAIDGTGNPQHRFTGTARATGAALRIASCALTRVDARMTVSATAGAIDATGPVGIAATTCPGLTLAPGRVRLTLASNPTFDRVAITAGLDGFAGRAGPARFAAIRGPIEASGALGALRATARLRVDALALPDAARAAAQSGAAFAGTPLAPTGARASAAVARLLTRSDATADLTARIQGTAIEIDLARVALIGRSGRLIAVAHDGMRWSAAGWRADADIVAAGDLPPLTVALRQSAPGAALTGSARLAPYRAGAAGVATAPIRFAWDGRRARFDTVVTVDGPVGTGFVQGLAVPVTGEARATGAFAIGQGCAPIAFERLRLASFRFDRARIAMCGRPLVARTGDGTIRIDATTGPVRLTGRTGAGAPVALDAARLRLTEAGFAAQRLAVAMGHPAAQTRLAVSDLRGTIRGGRLAGRFADMGGAIGNVPLDITEAQGDWSFADGALRLAGGLRVHDAATPARFNPLISDDAALSLKDNRITATATLREPARRTPIAGVRLTHDLADGAGQAQLDVPGIAFALKGLQPEALTPLTLGVIANVVGTVAGEGLIRWDAAGVTSSGTFGTDRIDLAAAFGPVTGIRGRILFTDLLGLVSAPNQEATIAEINPGIAVANGVVHYQLIGQNRVQVTDAAWPFAGGNLTLDPALLDFAGDAQRRLTFRLAGLDAAAFVQQLDFPNLSATGIFDGAMPIVFDQSGGRIEAGRIAARPGGGTIAYVGELTSADLGTMGKLAFDALKAIRYSSLAIDLDGRLDGEMVSHVNFTGVREATPEQSLVTRLIRNLPFRFNIAIRAPFRSLVGSARSYMNPALLLSQARSAPTPTPPAVQTPASAPMR
jgi:hypothetical protein